MTRDAAEAALSISIHAPREGCDLALPRFRFCSMFNLNPRTPRGVRLSLVITLSGIFPFQSTHPARGATPYGLPDPEALRISIHAPREGCDMVPPCLLCLRVYFNPRTPRGVRLLFATLLEGHNAISIHAPREGCDEPQEDDYCSHGISIHAPREGCDEGQAGPVHHDLYFNPRTPRGVRLLEMRCKERLKNFNPRTPRGVRHSLVWPFMRYRAFQSTHPARGATQTGLRHTLCQLFQSTHPARGATISAINSGCSKSFQSTHPARGATSQRLPYPYRRSISIHAPREGCDSPSRTHWSAGSDFNPRTPRGVRLFLCILILETI